jgi:pilus assembly protein CpaE
LYNSVIIKIAECPYFALPTPSSPSYGFVGLLVLNKGNAVMTEIRLLLVDDNPQFLESIKRMLSFEADFRILGSASSGKEALDLIAKTTFDVALVDIHLPDMHGFQLTEAISEADPTLHVIILSVDTEKDKILEAMRAGAKNFIPKPPSGEVLSNAIREAFQKRIKTAPLIFPEPENEKEPKQRGKIVAVYSGKGGVGCTFLATNLALHLHSRETPAVLIDGDLQFGDIPVFLNMYPRYTIYEFVDMAAELDKEVIEDVLLLHPSGLKVLAAPNQPELADGISAKIISKVFNTLCDHYPYLIVDMASELNDVALEIFELADLILMVMTPDIPSIKNMTYVMDVMNKLNVPSEKLEIVLNMVGQREDLTPVQVENGLKVPLAAQLPFDNASVKRSINRGEPLVLDGKPGILGRSLIHFVGAVKERLLGEVELA